MLRLTLPTVGLLGLLCFTAQAHDHNHDQHHTHNPDAHQHGIGRLDLVIENQQLILSLQMPAEDLLGFEHAPRTPEQQEQLTALQATLEQPQKLFALPDAAQCSLQSSELHSSLFAEPAQSGDDAQATRHADINALYHFNCARIERLKQIDVSLFQQFSGSEKLLLQAITPRGQFGDELSAVHNRIHF